MPRATIVAALLVLMFTGHADAQEKGQVGTSISFPGSVGLVWHASERVALRPDISFSWASSETASPVDPSGIVPRSSGNSTRFTVGLSALFYVKRWDALAAYVSPRFGYGRSSTTSRTNSTILPPEYQSGTTFETSSYETSGSFGVQYALGKRFSVFGEVGLVYADSGTSSDIPFLASSSSKSIGTRSGVGVVFYF